MRPRFTLRKMRSVHVIIATTMLAVPASAFALTGVTSGSGQSVQNPVQTPINLQVSPRHVQFGHAVTVSGTLSAADAGKRVVLQTAAKGESSWRSLGAATVGSAGRSGRASPRAARACCAPSSRHRQVPVTASRPGTVAPARRPEPPPTRTVTVGARFTPARHESAVHAPTPSTWAAAAARAPAPPGAPAGPRQPRLAHAEHRTDRREGPVSHEPRARRGGRPAVARDVRR